MSSFIISIIIISLAFTISTPILISRARKYDAEHVNEQNYCMQPPKAAFFTLGFLVLMLAVIGILGNIFMADLENFWMFNVMISVFVILGVISLLGLRTKIVVTGEQVDYYPAFGKKITFKFAEIDKVLIRRNRQGRMYTIYANGKKCFTLSEAQKYSSIFLNHVAKYNMEVVDKSQNIFW